MDSGAQPVGSEPESISNMPKAGKAAPRWVLFLLDRMGIEEGGLAVGKTHMWMRCFYRFCAMLAI